MILLILRVFIYYLLVGSIFSYYMANKIADIVYLMKESSDKLKDMPDERLKRILVIMFTFLWPRFLYYLTKKSQ